jgi:hypothetical protein
MPLFGAALTVLLVRRRGTPVEPDQADSSGWVRRLG